MAVVLGVDYGQKRIGLALSDADERIALAGPLIDGTGAPRRDAERVAQAAREHGVAKIVVGLPINMDGSEGPQAKLTRKFAEALSKEAGLQIEFWDERLSSAAADWALEQTELTRRKRRARRDVISAQIILQGWLDARQADTQ